MENITIQVGKRTVRINTRIAVIVAAIIALGALGYVSKGLFIAATVNGNPISRLAVIEKLEKESGKKLLDSLITEKLVQNELAVQKIVVSDNEINAEIKKIGDQIIGQGSTLNEALLAQGMTMDELKKQLILKKGVEKLVADKINVTDEEVAQYIKDNGISVTKDDLRNQKLNQEAGILISSLKSAAKIRYFVNY